MSNAQSLTDCESLAISQISPIRVWDFNEGGGTWLLPSLSHTEIMPTLWKVIHLIRSDWLEYVSHFAVPGNDIDESEKYLWQMNTFESLKSRYIQCLFSYINFFFTLENGFKVLLSELGEINKELHLNLKVPKHPKRPTYIEKLCRVRNNTVVHWGGPQKKNALDSRAGRFWGFSWPGKFSNLEDLRFGNESLQGANDRCLHSIEETHAICTKYLKEYDNKCTDLFGQIIMRLPITNGAKKYEHITVQR